MNAEPVRGGLPVRRALHSYNARVVDKSCFPPRPAARFPLDQVSSGIMSSAPASALLPGYQIAGRGRSYLLICRGKHQLGIHPEQRILLCLHDTIDFPTAFLGAIKAGSCRSRSILSFQSMNSPSCWPIAGRGRSSCRRRCCRP